MNDDDHDMMMMLMIDGVVYWTDIIVSLSHLYNQPTGRFNGTMQNVVGPTLVAMATKFGLGAKIQSPTGLSYQQLLRVIISCSVSEQDFNHVVNEWS